MILADKNKGHVQIDGNRAQILTELAVLIQVLIRSDIDDDEIMMAVKLGLADDDLNKMLNVAKETLEKKYEEYKNNENIKEIDI